MCLSKPTEDGTSSYINRLINDYVYILSCRPIAVCINNRILLSLDNLQFAPVCPGFNLDITKLADRIENLCPPEKVHICSLSL